jgi:hypothetical protein
MIGVLDATTPPVAMRRSKHANSEQRAASGALHRGLGAFLAHMTGKAPTPAVTAGDAKLKGFGNLADESCAR